MDKNHGSQQNHGSHFSQNKMVFEPFFISFLSKWRKTMVFFKIMESLFLKNPTIFSQIILLFSNFFYQHFLHHFLSWKTFSQKNQEKKPFLSLLLKKCVNFGFSNNLFQRILWSLTKRNCSLFKVNFQNLHPYTFVHCLFWALLELHLLEVCAYGSIPLNQ